MTWALQLYGDEDAEAFLGLFAHRRDAYAVQQDAGSYFKIDGELNVALAWRHLEGDITLGLYPLVGDSCICRASAKMGHIGGV